MENRWVVASKTGEHIVSSIFKSNIYKVQNPLNAALSCAFRKPFTTISPLAGRLQQESRINRSGTARRFQMWSDHGKRTVQSLANATKQTSRKKLRWQSTATRSMQAPESNQWCLSHRKQHSESIRSDYFVNGFYFISALQTMLVLLFACHVQEQRLSLCTVRSIPLFLALFQAFHNYRLFCREATQQKTQGTLRVFAFPWLKSSTRWKIYRWSDDGFAEMSYLHATTKCTCCNNSYLLKVFITMGSLLFWPSAEHLSVQGFTQIFRQMQQRTTGAVTSSNVLMPWTSFFWISWSSLLVFIMSLLHIGVSALPWAILSRTEQF